VTARLILGLTLALAAGSAAERVAPPWAKSQVRTGQLLYREHCVVCHDIDYEKSKKFGPNFYQLFKREKMPMAKMKPNRDYIKVRVKFGGPLMPAFRTRLTDAEIDTLIDYMASK
jgi:mono/diheme cytochrome c family protein